MKVESLRAGITSFVHVVYSSTFRADWSQCVGKNLFPWLIIIRSLQSGSCNPPQSAFRFTSRSHFPIVKNSLSPTSPRPGLIIPRLSICPSRPPTQISTDSIPFSSAARLTPSSLPSTLITTTFFTPHSISVCIAALEVPPVAITGSKRMAMEGMG